MPTASKQTSFQRQKQPRWQWGDHDWASLTSYRPSARPGPSQWSIPCTGRPRAQRSGPASSIAAARLVPLASSRCWAQFSEQGFGAIQRRFVGAFHYMLACVGQRGSRSRQTGAMVYRMGMAWQAVGHGSGMAQFDDPVTPPSRAWTALALAGPSRGQEWVKSCSARLSRPIDSRLSIRFCPRP